MRRRDNASKLRAAGLIGLAQVNGRLRILTLFITRRFISQNVLSVWLLKIISTDIGVHNHNPTLSLFHTRNPLINHQMSTALVTGADDNTALLSLGLTAAAAAALVIAESPSYLNGGLTRSAGWIKDAILQNVGPNSDEKAKSERRSAAATLLTAYLLGTVNDL
jgi:hypothetical protein